MNAEWKRMFTLSLSVTFYALPALLLLAINCRIFWLLRKSRQTFSDADQNSKTIIRRHQHVSNNIACVVLIFLICHLPFRVTSLWFTFAHVAAIRRLNLNQIMLIIYSSRACFYLNHAVNPLLYNFGSNNFRVKFRALVWTIWQKMCGQKRRKLSHTSFTSTHMVLKTVTVRHKSQSTPWSSSGLRPLPKHCIK